MDTGTPKKQTPSYPNHSANLLLSLIPGIGNKRYWDLVDHFGSAQLVLDTPPNAIPSLPKQARSALANYQQRQSNSSLAERADTILNKIKNHGGEVLDINHPSYPELLKAIDSPPPILYVKGNIHALCLPQLAIVGSRHATHEGVKNTRRFSQHLASNGLCITSGLALGIDAVAHQSVVDKQGVTIAVMATGIDDVYPKRHRQLADDILKNNGVLVTEFAPNTPPRADHFPRRNRIISGLSLGVLVVEAAIKSGSLITAQYAVDQGREVFAIPSSIHNPQAKGCHQLLKNGATLVECSDDIVEHLRGLLSHEQFHSKHNQNPPQSIESHAAVGAPVSPSIINTNITKDIKTTLTEQPHLSHDESLILNHIGFAPTTIEQLLHSTALPSQVVSITLINLEINGLIKRSDWGYERV